MPRGVWRIHCMVCDEIADGPPHGTTCFACEALGYKYCVDCEQILPLDAFYVRPDTGKRMTKCIQCYTTKRNKRAEVFRADKAYIARRNAQSAACKRRKYATDEGRIAEINRCHNRRTFLTGDIEAADWRRCCAYFENRCAYCGADASLTVDHIIPVSKFGANKLYNIVPACPHCNSSKCDHDIIEWYQKQPFYSVERLLKIHSWFKDQQGGGKSGPA